MEHESVLLRTDGTNCNDASICGMRCDVWIARNRNSALFSLGPPVLPFPSFSMSSDGLQVSAWLSTILPFVLTSDLVGCPAIRTSTETKLLPAKSIYMN